MAGLAAAKQLPGLFVVATVFGVKGG